MLNLSWRIWRYSYADSTNLIIKDAIAQGFSTGLVAVSERQRGGYGMRGHSWQSPKGGLYFSLLLKTTLPPRKLPEIPKRIANVIMITLQRFSTEKLAIKDPNDIVLSRSLDDDSKNEKLAGISTEIYKGFLVVGVGINFFCAENGARHEFTDKNFPVYLEDFANEKFENLSDVFDAILADIDDKLEI